MEIKCEYPNCSVIFHFSGHGRQPHFCHPHRIQINREKAAQWHRDHYQERHKRSISINPTTDPEAIIRPLISYKFDGPGLFESTEELFNKALDWKARTLNQSLEYVKTQWIHGQAGREFMQSFMHPDNCSIRYIS